MKKQINLYFDKNAKQAFELYKNAFNDELATYKIYTDRPSIEENEDIEEYIKDAEVVVKDNVLNISDIDKDNVDYLNNNLQITITLTIDEAVEVYNKLTNENKTSEHILKLDKNKELRFTDIFNINWEIKLAEGANEN